MGYVRITTGAYLVITNVKEMIEVKAKTEEKAREKVDYYLKDTGEYSVAICKIPAMIGYIDKFFGENFD